MAAKTERFQMSFSENQLKWLRQYMVDNAVNNVQDAVRHVLDRTINDQWELNQAQKKFLREYMAAHELDSLPDAIRHVVDRKLKETSAASTKRARKERAK